MEEVKVCRVCLVMDVKMYDLQSHPLNSYFRFVTGSNLLKIPNSPPVACYECATLIKKFHSFKQKIYKSEGLLNRCLNTNKEISISKLKEVDREDLGLCSNLRTHYTPSSVLYILSPDTDMKEELENGHLEFDVTNSINDEANLETDPINMETEIKEESNVEHSDIDSNTSTSNFEMNIKKEPVITNMQIECAENLTSPSVIVKNDCKKNSEHFLVVHPLVPKKREPIIENISSNFTINSLSEMIIRDQLGIDKIGPNLFKRSVHEGNSEVVSASVDSDDEPLLKRKNCEVQRDCNNLNNDMGLLKELQPTRVVSRKKKKKIPTRIKRTDDLLKHVTVSKLSPEEQIKDMNKRQKAFTYLNSPFKCDLCFKGFIDSTTWEAHRQQHSPRSGSSQCTICKIWFKYKHSWRAHLNRHEMRYSCKYCSHVACSVTQAKIHQQSHKKVSCKHCGEHFNIRMEYLNHMQVKHPSEFVCDLCGFTFISQFGLEKHKQLIHKQYLDIIKASPNDNHQNLNSVPPAQETKPEETSDCPTCGETFNDKEEMEAHCKEEHPVCSKKKRGTAKLKWPTKCKYCSEEIQNGREHWAHYRRMHPDKEPVEKKHTCDVCKKTFTRKSSLEYHGRTHTGERPYKCSKCKKTFAKLFNLQMHEKIHDDVYPFSCDFCQRLFKFKYAIKRHMASHNGDKPYQCEICSMKFTTTSHRKAHIKNVHFDMLKLVERQIAHDYQDCRIPTCHKKALSSI